jgi:hypothetical protein
MPLLGAGLVVQGREWDNASSILEKSLTAPLLVMGA